MYRQMMKSKIHRATVSEANLHYVGSITIDEALMEVADIWAHEKVQIVDVDNGSRLETYVIPGPRNSGIIGINGAAARLVHPGDTIIIISYGMMDEKEAREYEPKVVFVDGRNRVVDISKEEKHGEIRRVV